MKTSGHAEDRREYKKVYGASYYKMNKKSINQRNSDYWVHYGRFRFHGITEEKFSEMYKDQDGKCGICKVPLALKGKGTHIDHDHSTNEVRGLLCGRCNKGLGHFKDDEGILAQAIQYLAKSKGIN